MEKINPIAEELQELGSMLAKIPAATPYQPEPGFFDNFPDLMLGIARDQDQSLSLPGLEAPFSVPEGYFEGLAGSILDKVRRLDLVTATDGAEHDVNANEEINSIAPLLGSLSRKMPYSLPDNYFADLPGHLSVTGEVLSPLMLGLRGVNVYRVPQGYFEKLPGELISKVKQPVAKVIKGNFGSRFGRYAAAAVIAGAMITGGFFLLNRNQDGQQIVSAKGLEEKTAQTSDEDILRYLENQPLPSFDVQPVTNDEEIKDDAILDLLADVSDEELQQYLKYQSDAKEMFN